MTYQHTTKVIEKYWVRKLLHIQNRFLIAKENEILKQVVYVNYTLNELKELTQVLLSSKKTCPTAMFNKFVE